MKYSGNYVRQYIGGGEYGLLPTLPTNGEWPVADCKYEIFLTAAILNPAPRKKDEEGEPERPEFVVAPAFVLARNADEAKLMCTMSIPKEHAGKTTRLEVRVIPFRA